MSKIAGKLAIFIKTAAEIESLTSTANAEPVDRYMVGLGRRIVVASPRREASITPETVSKARTALKKGWTHVNENNNKDYQFDNFRKGKKVKSRLNIVDPAGQYHHASAGVGRKNQLLFARSPLTVKAMSHKNPEDKQRMDDAIRNYGERQKSGRRIAKITGALTGIAGGVAGNLLGRGSGVLVRGSATALMAGVGGLTGLTGSAIVANERMRNKYMDEIPDTQALLMSDLGGSISRSIGNNAELAQRITGRNTYHMPM